MLDDCLNYKEESSLGGQQLTLTGWVGGWVTGKSCTIVFQPINFCLFLPSFFFNCFFLWLCLHLFYNLKLSSCLIWSTEIWALNQVNRTWQDSHGGAHLSKEIYWRLSHFCISVFDRLSLSSLYQAEAELCTADWAEGVHSSKCCSSDQRHPFRFGFWTHALFIIVLYPFRHKFI